MGRLAMTWGFLNGFDSPWGAVHKKVMILLRLAVCAVSAFMVGCASKAPYSYASAEPAKVEFPAGTVVRTETVYSAPAYAPVAVAPAQSFYAAPVAVTAYEPAAVTAPAYGSVAENGSYYGQPNANGVPKTVAVGGYYRKDGTYVRGHYRSAPGSNPPSTRRRK